MHKYLNTFYLKHIRPVDPGFFLTRYAGKAAFSCMASFFAALALGIQGRMLFWWMAGAVCTVLFRTGSTLKRRKIYALILLAIIFITVPVSAVLGQNDYLSLGFIFILAFACFFVASAGLSASTIGNGCLIVTLISMFSPAAGFEHCMLRSVSLLSGGLISFFTNFYILPFDPEKVIFSSAKVANEDLVFFFQSVCFRLKNQGLTDKNVQKSSQGAIASVRRYRSFLESFNIDPLKSTGAAGSPGRFYLSLVRMYEAIVGLSNHIHFADNRPEFNQLKKDFYQTASGILDEYSRFSKFRKQQAVLPGPDFEKVNHEIDQIRESLLTLGGYRKGDEVQEKFLDAWAAVYELKNVLNEFQGIKQLAEKNFQRGRF